MLANAEWELHPSIDPETYVRGMVVEVVVVAILAVFWFLLLQKYVKKRSALTRSLAAAYGGVLFTILCTMLEKVLVVSGATTYTYIIYEFKIGVVGTLGTLWLSYFLAAFTLDLFADDPGRWRKVLATIKGVAGLLAGYALVLLVLGPMTDEVMFMLSLPLIAGYALMLLPVLLIMAAQGIKQSSKVTVVNATTYLGRASIRSIGINGLILVAFLVTYAIDFVVIRDQAMTIFYFIAWGLLIASFAFAYVGFDHPRWMVRLVGARYEKKRTI
jgi:hypothetical protein